MLLALQISGPTFLLGDLCVDSHRYEDGAHYLQAENTDVLRRITTSSPPNSTVGSHLGARLEEANSSGW